ncbi:MAG: HNH endonuclease, partial [Candidatus Pelagibacter sp.]|nr:HNH endonuclease [Candidatus Pelagibacter sp.]
MVEFKKFSLSDNFIDGYKRKRAPFGFNGLGELVYMRTYSRIKEDGKNEMWWETVKRVVEGTYNMQKQHIERYDLGWNAWQAQRSAQEMYDRIFNMKFLPPGRGLWSMGTALTEEKGLYAALNNCAFVSTQNLKDDLSKPFTFLMDASMVGVGVGFDTKGAETFVVRGPKTDREPEIYHIPDTREGWVESLARLLDSYFLGIANVNFDYTQIREAGAPIKGFGGVSSGYEPLEEVHTSVREVLDKNVGSPITITTIVDIMNLIGKCVVAGNVRRTAEIVFGDSNSDEYINLKNYKKNPDREQYGWTSNNSIFAELGMDYREAADRINDNGEPGFAWLQNMQDYSRMKNGRDKKDHRVSGGNPCVVGDTLVAVADGRNAIPIKDLVDTQYPVYSVDGNGKVVIKQSIKTWKTKENTEIWKLTLDDGSDLLATPDHKIMLRDGEYKKLKDLEEGESVFPFNSFSNKGYRNIRGTGKRKSGIRQYRLITEHELGYMPNAKEYAIHHIDFDKTNDSWDNLDVITQSEHSRLHRLINNPMHNLEYVEKMKNTREERGYNLPENNPMYGKHHKKSTLTSIGKKSKQNWKNQKDFMVESIRNGMTSEVRKHLSDIKKERTVWVKWSCPVCNKQKRLTEYQSSKRKTCSYSCSNVKRGMVNQGIWNHKVVSVEFYGYEDVYDMTIEDTHNFGVITSTTDDKYLESSGLFIHNCLEQSLESYELCCLVETFPSNHEDLEDYLKTLKYAYLYAKTVTLGKTHWPETNRVMLRNRRIGCSVSGIAQFISKPGGIDKLRCWLKQGYDAIEDYDKLYSDWLAVPRSIKTTSVKPSGTVSL